MKIKNLLTFVFVLVSCFHFAQMDDKFYQPSKTMKTWEFSTPVEAISLAVEADTITAYVVKPAQKKIEKTIIFFHGANGNATTYQFMTKPLVNAGYQLVMVDVRGYGKSTGKPTHKNVALDAQSMLDHVLSRADIKSTKIYLYGASLGSQVAIHIASANKAKLSGLIIDGGMSSFADIATIFAPQYADFIAQMLASTYSAKEDIKKTEGLSKLLIYSRNDTTVPFSQGEELMRNASEPKSFLETTSEHISGLKDETQKVISAINKL